MAFITLSNERFEQFANTVEHRYFEQSVNMKELLSKRGYQTELVGYEDDNQTLQVAALLYSAPMTGGVHIEIHYGPLYKNTTYLKAFLIDLKKYAKAKKAIELLVKPYDIYQFYNDHGQPISPENNELLALFESCGYTYTGLTQGFTDNDWHYVKNLENLTQEKLINSFSKKGKPLVKKAKTFGIKVRPLARHELHLFKDITSSTSDRRDYNDKPLEYYEYLFDSFADKAEFLVATLNFNDYYKNLEKDQAKLATRLEKLEADLETHPHSEKKRNQHREFSSQYQTFEVRKNEAKTFIEKYGDKDVILSGAVFIFTKQEAVYFFSGSYTEFNKFYAPAILQEYIMLKAIKANIKRYNLLGIEGIFDGSDGVLGFKQNFNGHIERKAGSFYYYPNPSKHKLIKLVKTLLRRN
ncbi:peptidoglycan branched peptide synthesis protein [Streptococcus iniae]|uniref:aminoacyltransferase n=1 Tax=Streptococcus iniae TaxID=1346 RepID=UPI000EF65741|nr:aminoacyltransferase [Streptococcus iniae]RLV27572.1 peptidoglycan branched peptide synthesis protein [Streptococcus iniae]